MTPFIHSGLVQGLSQRAGKPNMPCHEAFDHSYLGPCPTHRRLEALSHLAAFYDPAQQSALKASLERAQAGPPLNWEGFWIITRAERIEATLWVEPLADATAQVWLPARQNSAAEALLAGVHRWVSRQGFDLCHVMLSSGQSDWAAMLAASGMERIARVAHLRAPCAATDTASSPLLMAPFGGLSRARQLALLRAISEASLDCPALLEALSMETLLAGFYAQAPAAPRHWYQAIYKGETVGVLLLAPQTSSSWELQLMGIVPAWRGKGLGQALVEQAKALTHQGGAHTLTLTVDAHNTPAWQAYTRAGFSGDSTQQLYAWRREEPRGRTG